MSKTSGHGRLLLGDKSILLLPTWWLHLRFLLWIIYLTEFYYTMCFLLRLSSPNCVKGRVRFAVFTGAHMITTPV